MAKDLSNSIAQSALGPSSVSGDGQSVTLHSLRDQIEADKYLRQVEAARNRRPGFRLSKIAPGGAV